MEKFTTKQLLETASELLKLADTSEQLGLIRTYKSVIEVGTESYEFSICINQYYDDEKKWTAVCRNWGDDQRPHNDMEAAAALKNHLESLLEVKKAEVRELVELLNL